MHRRVKADLVMCCKILHNVVNVDCVNFFLALHTFLYQRNVTELNKPRIISARDSHFFTNRTVNDVEFFSRQHYYCPNCKLF